MSISPVSSARTPATSASSEESHAGPKATQVAANGGGGSPAAVVHISDQARAAAQAAADVDHDGDSK